MIKWWCCSSGFNVNWSLIFFKLKILIMFTLSNFYHISNYMEDGWQYSKQYCDLFCYIQYNLRWPFVLKYQPGYFLTISIASRSNALLFHHDYLYLLWFLLWRVEFDSRYLAKIFPCKPLKNPVLSSLEIPLPGCQWGSLN